jgi:hypothetical protein
MTKKNKVIRRDRMPAVDTPMSDTLTVILALDVWNACVLAYLVCLILIGALWISFFVRLSREEYIDVVEKDNGIKS